MVVSVETAVRSFLKDQLGKDVTRVGPDDSLLEAGVVDSMGVMQLVTYLETNFGITVPDDDLMPENFDSIAAIVAFVNRRKAGPGD